MLVVHTVSFDSQGGSAVNPVAVTHEATVAKPDDSTKNGYVFGGWYKESGCTNAWIFDTDTVTRDMILYARWIQDSRPGGDPSDGGGEYNPLPLISSLHQPHSPTVN